jgi:hypothetical protein
MTVAVGVGESGGVGLIPSEIDAHGSQSPLDQQDSRSLLQPGQSVS